MKILVSGGWSYGNIGDEAIATATEYLLRRSFPETELTFTAYDPENFATCHGIQALASVHKQLSRFPAEVLTLEGVLGDLPRYGLSEFAGELDSDTLFVMSGGGYFTESWGSQFVARLAELAIAREKGAKIAVIGKRFREDPLAHYMFLAFVCYMLCLVSISTLDHWFWIFAALLISMVRVLHRESKG